MHRLPCSVACRVFGKCCSCKILASSSKMKPLHIPSQARDVFDVSGAGDTVVSVLGLAKASGLSFEEASFLSNVAGGLIVEKLGTATLTRKELISALDSGLRSNKSPKRA